MLQSWPTCSRYEVPYQPEVKIWIIVIDSLSPSNAGRRGRPGPWSPHTRMPCTFSPAPHTHWWPIAIETNFEQLWWIVRYYSNRDWILILCDSPIGRKQTREHALSLWCFIDGAIVFKRLPYVADQCPASDASHDFQSCQVCFFQYYDPIGDWHVRTEILCIPLFKIMI